MSFFSWLFARSGPEDRFARQVLGRLRAAGIRNGIYHREQFAIEYRTLPDHDPTWMYLGNLFAECRRDPGTRLDRIERFVATVVSPPSMPETWEEARDLLRPVLRGASFGRGGPTSRRTVLRRPALPYLDELVVVDQPTSMGYVAEGMWQVPSEQIFATARANLDRGDSPPRRSTPGGGSGTLTFFDSNDAYVVSRLLLDGWLAGLAEEVGGRPVAFAPDPTSLIVAADDVVTLARLFEAAEEAYVQAPRPLSPVGYTVNDRGHIVPYTVPRDHPLAGVVTRASRALASVEYETQRVVLQPGTETSQYAVASCLLIQRPDRTAFTIARWSGQQPMLLPVVDYIALDEAATGGEDSPGFIPWQALLDEDLLVEAVEYRPTRYWIEGQTRPDVLARLLQRAIAHP
ncbi:MAG: hypothetical protein HKP61_10535 [Dactylosporangium sp.]|nr:hypothetical protein [Dactylosporangium sp.]NNJ61366.1 hypothetical protein [Dactylosporangium sp.]